MALARGTRGRDRATSKSVFTLNELISFVQKSPFPLFQRGNLKVSLCKGRFRGIFDPAQRDFDGTVEDGIELKSRKDDSAQPIRPHATLPYAKASLPLIFLGCPTFFQNDTLGRFDYGSCRYLLIVAYCLCLGRRECQRINRGRKGPHDLQAVYDFCDCREAPQHYEGSRLKTIQGFKSPFGLWKEQGVRIAKLHRRIRPH